MSWLDESLDWIGGLLPYLLGAVVVVVLFSAFGGPGHGHGDPQDRDGPKPDP